MSTASHNSSHVLHNCLEVLISQPSQMAIITPNYLPASAHRLPSPGAHLPSVARASTGHYVCTPASIYHTQGVACLHRHPYRQRVSVPLIRDRRPKSELDCWVARWMTIMKLTAKRLGPDTLVATVVDRIGKRGSYVDQ
ncbi:UNVERIFIED_CONTAM: hypothetical protein Sindi_2007100 [Sesamum indicum]